MTACDTVTDVRPAPSNVNWTRDGPPVGNLKIQYSMDCTMPGVFGGPSGRAQSMARRTWGSRLRVLCVSFGRRSCCPCSGGCLTQSLRTVELLSSRVYSVSSVGWVKDRSGSAGTNCPRAAMKASSEMASAGGSESIEVPPRATMHAS